MGWHHGVLLNFFQDERYFIDIDLDWATEM